MELTDEQKGIADDMIKAIISAQWNTRTLLFRDKSIDKDEMEFRDDMIFQQSCNLISKFRQLFMGEAREEAYANTQSVMDELAVYIKTGKFPEGWIVMGKDHDDES